MKHLNYLWLASFAALASCSSDEYLGEQGGLAQNGMKEISFASNTPNVTRANAEGETAANLLGKQFYVYGAKQTGKTDVAPIVNTYSPVFDNYSVWYTGGKSTSNSEGWEYVGTTAGFSTVSGVPRQNTVKDNNQTIKYWDYTAEDYWFYALSVENNTTTDSESEDYTFNPGTNGKIGTATISHVKEDNTIFYANAVNRAKTSYANTLAPGQTNTAQPVKFTFKRLQSKVRIGFYETVPGYAINEVKFYAANATIPTEVGASIPFGTSNDAGDVIIVTNTKTSAASTIDKGFIPASGQTYTVTYDHEHDGKASLENTTNSGNPTYETSKTFGKLNYTVVRDLTTAANEYYMGETAATPTWAVSNPNNTASVSAASPYMGTDGNNYWLVLPNESQSASFKIKVDYTLTSLDGSHETIKVTGAEAVVPEQYCHWMGNTAYTYLFKISDNTNGTTGNPDDPSDPAGLYPITFDACVEDVITGNQETITTVATPSITTHSTTSNVITNNEYLASETVVLNVEGATAVKWAWLENTTAITEQEAAVLDANTSPSWNELTGNELSLSGHGGKYIIVRLTYAEKFKPASGTEVPTTDYTDETLETPVADSTTANGTDEYYHKKYAYKVIKVTA